MTNALPSRATTETTLPLWAQNLKKYRKASGFTQTQFGKQFGVSAMAVSYWEAAVSEPPAPVLCWLLVAAGVISESSVVKAGFKFRPDDPEPPSETKELRQHVRTYRGR